MCLEQSEDKISSSVPVRVGDSESLEVVALILDAQLTLTLQRWEEKTKGLSVCVQIVRAGLEVPGAKVVSVHSTAWTFIRKMRHLDQLRSPRKRRQRRKQDNHFGTIARPTDCRKSKREKKYFEGEDDTLRVTFGRKHKKVCRALLAAGAPALEIWNHKDIREMLVDVGV